MYKVKFALWTVLVICLISSAWASALSHTETKRIATEKYNKKDLLKLRTKAKKLIMDGQYEEALNIHLWYHENALSIDPAQRAVRLSFWLSDWARLGRMYAPALEEFDRIRKNNMEMMLQGKGTVDIFNEIEAMNHYANVEVMTAFVFKQLDARNPDMAEKVYRYAVPSLIKKGYFNLASKYMKDPVRLYNKYVEKYCKNTVISDEENYNKEDIAFFNSVDQNLFIESVSDLITVLIASGRMDEAIDIRDRACKLTDQTQIISAFEKAEKTHPQEDE